MDDDYSTIFGALCITMFMSFSTYAGVYAELIFRGGERC
jgi:hypothetical protein